MVDKKPIIDLSKLDFSKSFDLQKATKAIINHDSINNTSKELRDKKFLERLRNKSNQSDY